LEVSYRNTDAMWSTEFETLQVVFLYGVSSSRILCRSDVFPRLKELFKS